MANYQHAILGEINEATIGPALQTVWQAQLGDEVVLTLCSEGGYTAPAYALIDAMAASPARVVTVAAGCVMSAALDIFVAGDWRAAYPSAIGMSHNAFIGPGTKQAARSKREELRLDDERGMRLYKARSKYRTEEEVRAKLFKKRRDVWMNAQQMLEHGLADEVLQPGPKPFILAAKRPRRAKKAGEVLTKQSHDKV